MIPPPLRVARLLVTLTMSLLLLGDASYSQEREAFQSPGDVEDFQPSPLGHYPWLNTPPAAAAAPLAASVNGGADAGHSFAPTSGAVSPAGGDFWNDDVGMDSGVANCSCDLHLRHHPDCLQCRPRPVSWLDDSSLLLGGWAQAGTTLNPDDPNNGLNSPVLFNDAANDIQLNQLYFFLGKEVRPDGQNWDIGGRFDVTYGSDSRFVTVPGLEERTDRSAHWNRATADYGLAIPQAYADVATPVGGYGSTIRLGHFYSFGGYETFAAPDNFFYSHAYTFVYGQPFTHTGAMWYGRVNETTAASIAATTGWDSLYTSGDTWAIQASLMRKLGDGRTTLSLTGSAGNDFTGITTAAGPENAGRAWTSLVLKHYLRKQLSYVLQADFGFQDDAVLLLDGAASTVGFDAATWWGVNQYLVYDLNESWSTGLRFEWFRDEGNSRVGVPAEYVANGPVFNGSDYFALTGGVNYRPHRAVTLRSELRWDTSDVRSNPAVPGGVAGIRPFNDRSDRDQLTIGTDLIVTF